MLTVAVFTTTTRYRLRVHQLHPATSDCFFGSLGSLHASSHRVPSFVRSLQRSAYRGPAPALTEVVPASPATYRETLLRLLPGMSRCTCYVHAYMHTSITYLVPALSSTWMCVHTSCMCVCTSCVYVCLVRGRWTRYCVMYLQRLCRRASTHARNPFQGG